MTCSGHLGATQFPCMLAEHDHVAWQDVEPPHEVRDRDLVTELMRTLRRHGHLPPLLLWGDRLLTGSHRYEAFSLTGDPVCVIRLPRFAEEALVEFGFSPDEVEFPDAYDVLFSTGFTDWYDEWTEEYGYMTPLDGAELAVAFGYATERGG